MWEEVQRGCISVLHLCVAKRNVLTFVCLDPSCQLITARQRGGSSDEETLLDRPGKPKHAARLTSACLTGTLLHRERFYQQMTWFSSTEEFSVPSKAVIIYLNVIDVFVYQMLRKT